MMGNFFELLNICDLSPYPSAAALPSPADLSSTCGLISGLADASQVLHITCSAPPDTRTWRPIRWPRCYALPYRYM